MQPRQVRFQSPRKRDRAARARSFTPNVKQLKYRLATSANDKCSISNDKSPPSHGPTFLHDASFPLPDRGNCHWKFVNCQGLFWELCGPICAKAPRARLPVRLLWHRGIRTSVSRPYFSRPRSGRWRIPGLRASPGWRRRLC